MRNTADARAHLRTKLVGVAQDDDEAQRWRVADEDYIKTSFYALWRCALSARAAFAQLRCHPSLSSFLAFMYCEAFTRVFVLLPPPRFFSAPRVHVCHQLAQTH